MLCYYKLILIWISYVGIKFRKELFSRVFNFAISFTITKNAKM